MSSTTGNGAAQPKKAQKEITTPRANEREALVKLAEKVDAKLRELGKSPEAIAAEIKTKSNVDISGKTIRRMTDAESVRPTKRRAVLDFLGIESEEASDDDEVGWKPRKLRAVRNGQSTFRYLMYADRDDVRVEVQRDPLPDEGKVHEAVIALCNVVDRLSRAPLEGEYYRSKPGSGEPLSAREIYENGKAIGDAARVLKENEWQLTLEQVGACGPDGSYRPGYFFTFHVRALAAAKK